MKLADLVGKPAEMLVKAAPKQLSVITNVALRNCMGWAADTIPVTAGQESFSVALAGSAWSGVFHQMAAGMAGAVGGVFGFAGLAVELPVTTGIMLRSIASIAAEFGEDLSDPKVLLECLAVFAYGGPSSSDDEMNSSFLTMRVAMATLIKNAAVFIGGKGPAAIAAAVAAGGAAPPLVKLIATVAARFEVAVTEKFVAQSLPIIGAVSGAGINAAFAGYFNSVARYHFGIKQMEERFGESTVKAAYEAERALLPKRVVKLPKTPTQSNENPDS